MEFYKYEYVNNSKLGERLIFMHITINFDAVYCSFMKTEAIELFNLILMVVYMQKQYCT